MFEQYAFNLLLENEAERAMDRKWYVIWPYLKANPPKSVHARGTDEWWIDILKYAGTLDRQLRELKRINGWHSDEAKAKAAEHAKIHAENVRYPAGEWKRIETPGQQPTMQFVSNEPVTELQQHALDILDGEFV